MGVEIHPSAVVYPGALLDENVKVGPFAVIGEHVTVGRSTVVESGAHIRGYTRIGKSCQIFSYAVVGSPPQDLKYQGQESYLIIGENNVIREFATINPGTEKGSETVIGNNNLIMAYSHIAHDCKIGNENVFANVVNFAGHVQIEDKVVIGGLAGVHQFCRIGSYSIIGGCSKVVQDIPPYSLCDGHPAKVRGINFTGLKRRGVSKETIKAMRQVFKTLFFDGHSLNKAKDLLDDDFRSIPEIEYLLRFLSSSRRGICR